MDRDGNSNTQNIDDNQIQDQLGQKSQFTEEERRVLKKCSNESFYYRCIPLGIVFVGATRLLVNKGFLKPHARFGFSVKAFGAWFSAYVIGKLSYVGVCKERILQLENSPIAEMLRQSRKAANANKFQDPYGDRQDFGSSVPPPSVHERSQDSSTSPSNSPDLDKKGVYDDLRDQNRHQFQRKQYQPKPRQPTQQPPSSQSPYPPQQQPYSSEQQPQIPQQQPVYPAEPTKPATNSEYGLKDSTYNKKSRKNIYGDVVD